MSSALTGSFFVTREVPSQLCNSAAVASPLPSVCGPLVLLPPDLLSPCPAPPSLPHHPLSLPVFLGNPTSCKPEFDFWPTCRAH